MDKQKTIKKYVVVIAMVAAMLLTMTPAVTAYKTDVFNDTMDYISDIATALEDEDAEGNGGEIRSLVIAAFGILLFIGVFVVLLWILGWIPSLFDISNVKKIFKK